MPEIAIVDDQPKHNKPARRPARTQNLEKAKKRVGLAVPGKGEVLLLMCACALAIRLKEQVP